jgi:hypothetical protein
MHSTRRMPVQPSSAVTRRMNTPETKTESLLSRIKGSDKPKRRLARWWLNK